MDDIIFHEKQQGSLCAQHCLNTLLQGAYFTAVDLSQLAQGIDEEERLTMAEGGQNSEDYRKFIEGPSHNMDDTGYFSVQVLNNALKIWNLDMIPYNSKSPVAVQFQQDPTLAQAYICNYREHWFTVRKFGPQWINLNSLLSKPKPITDTYLSLYLKQLQIDGYSIFIITGSLPESTADQYLQDNPLPSSYFAETSTVSKSKQSKDEAKLEELADADSDDPNLRAVLEKSYLDSLEDEQYQLELAMRMSLDNDLNK